MEGITFDLNQKTLDESYLEGLGNVISLSLKRMFGLSSLPVRVKGRPEQVRTFIDATRGEGQYLDSIRRYGLDSEATYQSRLRLDSAIKGFEQETGLVWPIRN